ncbi:hypothetical protein [Adhaeribacter pallidiroseus]|uniref:Uncharacterized protein n=1 Tax=Adhaeribacter pallidiroseus TaxID=2072847 RepID=A0A369QFI3_9BACT|nr:hypothetical protein [Adhaeribacter pallidiroseus]RDC61649.1 hypothetical protein AHMF7616_00229 [Adhaeribacter pallidiroseus]
MKKWNILIGLFLLFTLVVNAQSPTDSLRGKKLNEVTVTGRKSNIERLPRLKDTFLFSGKKTK